MVLWFAALWTWIGLTSKYAIPAFFLPAIYKYHVFVWVFRWPHLYNRANNIRCRDRAHLKMERIVKMLEQIKIDNDVMNMIRVIASYWQNETIMTTSYFVCMAKLNASIVNSN